MWLNQLSFTGRYRNELTSYGHLDSNCHCSSACKYKLQFGSREDQGSGSHFDGIFIRARGCFCVVALMYDNSCNGIEATPNSTERSVDSYHSEINEQ